MRTQKNKASNTRKAVFRVRVCGGQPPDCGVIALGEVEMKKKEIAFRRKNGGERKKKCLKK